MALEHILLGMLRRPASGYDLKQSFSSSLRHFWRAELAQIYPLLARLEQRGLLVSEQQVSSKGPPRKVYTRTEDGERELLEWLRQGPEPDRDRIGYLAQVFFLDQLHDREAAEQFLGKLRVDLGERLAELQAIEQHWSENDPRYPDELPDDDFYPQLTLRMGITKLTALAGWCDESLKRIAERRNKQQKNGPTLADPPF